MANVLAELTEQLAKKVGGDDIAKGIIEGFQMQKGANRNTVQKQVRNLLKSIDADDAVRQAKFADNFVEGAGGQIGMKGLVSNTPNASPVNNAAQNAAAAPSNAIDGQISMFQDSTGQMHTPDTKIRQIKEARSQSSRSKMESMTKDGLDGQMYMNFGGMEDPSIAKNAAAKAKAEATAAVDEAAKVKADVEGQQSFMIDKNGYVNSEYGVRQMREAEVKKANRGWVRRRLSGAGESLSNLFDTVTGTGDGARRIAGRRTRNAERKAANKLYIETGQGSAQSKKEFFKNYKKNRPETPSNLGPSSNASDYTNILGASEASDVAEEMSSNVLGELIQQHPYIAAGIAGGVGVAVGGMIFDDDE